MDGQNTGHTAPGLIVPPPLIYLPSAGFGLACDWIWPVAMFPDALRYVLGGGFCWSAWSSRRSSSGNSGGRTLTLTRASQSRLC